MAILPERLIELPPSVIEAAVEAIVIPAKFVPAAKSLLFDVRALPSKTSESSAEGAVSVVQFTASVQFEVVAEPPSQVRTAASTDFAKSGNNATSRQKGCMSRMPMYLEKSHSARGTPANTFRKHVSQ
jgi:hypothetical protein